LFIVISEQSLSSENITFFRYVKCILIKNVDTNQNVIQLEAVSTPSRAQTTLTLNTVTEHNTGDIKFVEREHRSITDEATLNRTSNTDSDLVCDFKNEQESLAFDNAVSLEDELSNETGISSQVLSASEQALQDLEDIDYTTLQAFLDFSKQLRGLVFGYEEIGSVQRESAPSENPDTQEASGNSGPNRMLIKQKEDSQCYHLSSKHLAGSLALPNSKYRQIVEEITKTVRAEAMERRTLRSNITSIVDSSRNNAVYSGDAEYARGETSASSSLVFPDSSLLKANKEIRPVNIALHNYHQSRNEQVETAGLGSQNSLVSDRSSKRLHRSHHFTTLDDSIMSGFRPLPLRSSQHIQDDRKTDDVSNFGRECSNTSRKLRTVWQRLHTYDNQVSPRNEFKLDINELLYDNQQSTQSTNEYEDTTYDEIPDHCNVLSDRNWENTRPSNGDDTHDNDTTHVKRVYFHGEGEEHADNASLDSGCVDESTSISDSEHTELKPRQNSANLNSRYDIRLVTLKLPQSHDQRQRCSVGESPCNDSKGFEKPDLCQFGLSYEINDVLNDEDNRGNSCEEKQGVWFDTGSSEMGSNNIHDTLSEDSSVTSQADSDDSDDDEQNYDDDNADDVNDDFADENPV